MRILGIDPALRNTGYGVIETEDQAQPGRESLSLVCFGVIRIKQEALPSTCLLEIHRQLQEVVSIHRPVAAAIEGIIYAQNYKTAITLGAARGAALLAVTEAGLPAFEYAPRRVKAAATGRGGAQKNQVGFMIRALLGLTESPPADASDALAIALTHAQSRQGLTQGIRL